MHHSQKQDQTREMCSMSLKSLFTLTFYLFCQLHHGVHGGRIVTKVEDMEKIEDMEMGNKLKTLNRRPIKTLKTEEGDNIDCIDIYEQSSLSHPLLKNHKIQMRPTSVPKDLSVGPSSAKKKNYIMATSELANCPTGTVPIRRTNKDDLIRAKSFSESLERKILPLTKLTPGKHLAIVRSVPNPKIKYKGVGALFNVNNLTVGAKQSTFSQVWIEGGARNVLNSLQTGWMIAPDLYGDSRTWSFIYWRGINNTGCFNYLCKGFVQVHKRYGIGVALKTSTWFDKVQIGLTKVIFQDRATGHWWLRNTYANANIGYWPKELVPQLAQGASQVVWGGQTLGVPHGLSPPMGNGLFPHGKKPASFIKEMQILDQFPNTFIDPAGPYYQTETFMDTLNYKLDDYGYNGDYYRFSFWFGGPANSDLDRGK